MLSAADGGDLSGCGVSTQQQAQQPSIASLDKQRRLQAVLEEQARQWYEEQRARLEGTGGACSKATPLEPISGRSSGAGVFPLSPSTT
jgi:hypothetical protein